MTKQFPHSSGNHFGQKYRIESHDIQLHDDTPLDNDGVATPFVKGVLIHVGILGFIVLTNLPPNLSQQPAVQTSLISPDELATIQSQVLANRSQAAKADNHDPNAPATNPSGGSTASGTSRSVPVNVSSDGNVIPSSKTEPSSASGSANTQTTTKVPVTLPTKEQEIEPSAEAKKLNELLEKRQKEFDKALENFEKQENKQYQAKKQERITQKQEEEKQERELVDVFKSAEREADKIVEENRKKHADESKKRAAEQAKKDALNKATTGSLASDGTPTTSNTNSPPAPPSTGYSGEADSSSGSTRTQTNNLSLAGAKVSQYLNPPLGSGNDTTKLKITVDAYGNVRRAIATGSNKDLNRAAEQAAKAASPLPIKQGDRSYPTFSFVLQGEGTL